MTYFDYKLSQRLTLQPIQMSPAEEEALFYDSFVADTRFLSNLIARVATWTNTNRTIRAPLRTHTTRKVHG